MDGKTNALNGNGASVTYSVIQVGTGGATGGQWQYTAPAGKKIANVVVTYSVHYDGADWIYTYDAKDRSLRLTYGGAFSDVTTSIIEATETYLKFGVLRGPARADAKAIISLY